MYTTIYNEMNTLIKSGIQYIYNVTKYFYFNAVLLNHILSIRKN